MSEQLEPAVRCVGRVYVGVESFGPVVRCFRDGLGWVVTDHDAIPAADSAWLWGVDAEAEVVTLAPADDCPSGDVALLRFPKLDVKSYGAPSMVGYGYTAISIQANDLTSTIERVASSGGRAASSPVTYEVPRPGRAAHNTSVLMALPSDVTLVIAQPSDPRPTWTWEHRPEAPTTEVNFLIYRTPMWKETVEWWGPTGLGLDQPIAVKAGGPLGAELFGTVTGLDIDNAVTTNRAAARAEIHGPDLAGNDADEDLRPVQSPGQALGQVMWSVSLDSRPADFAAWARSRGATIVRNAERLRSPHFGTDAVAVVAGPDGQRVLVRFRGAPSPA